jgi:HD superfamily phosphodiesterase
MNEDQILEAKRFLVNYLKGRKCEYDQMHPWREPWEFVALHSFRVEAYAVKILEREAHTLSEEEIMLTRLGAILHDVGRIHQRENHALIGRGIVEEEISSGRLFSGSNIDIPRLLHFIETHSNKEEKDDDLCSTVIKDADVLDEIGAISIFMASTWIDRGNPYFFALLNQRVKDREVSFCDEALRCLNTESAKRILHEKKEFIEGFHKQLSDEVKGTEEFGKVTLEDYFA